LVALSTSALYLFMATMLMVAITMATNDSRATMPKIFGAILKRDRTCMETLDILPKRDSPPRHGNRRERLKISYNGCYKTQFRTGVFLGRGALERKGSVRWRRKRDGLSC